MSSEHLGCDVVPSIDLGGRPGRPCSRYVQQKNFHKHSLKVEISTVCSPYSVLCINEKELAVYRKKYAHSKICFGHFIFFLHLKTIYACTQ